MYRPDLANQTYYGKGEDSHPFDPARRDVDNLVEFNGEIGWEFIECRKNRRISWGEKWIWVPAVELNQDTWTRLKGTSKNNEVRGG